MEKKTYNVPAGIRYISQIPNVVLPEKPTIINKTICGCGFTEWCINSEQYVILLSPRRILLENKKEQHPEANVYYFRNDGNDNLTYDQELHGKKQKGSVSDNAERIDAMKRDLKAHVQQCIFAQRPCKILTTYDSFRLVREALGESISHFYCVVDEFQSIWIDSRFKSETEMELLYQLQGLERICFVSATPMIDKYLEQLEAFKDLPYIEMNWEKEEPGRVQRPDIGEPKECANILEKVSQIIRSYQNGKYDFSPNYDRCGNYDRIVISTEAVIYVNSVRMICNIIKKCGLTLENTNVLCAKTDENKKKVAEAFGIKSPVDVIGSVPKKGEPHKMFTLCTRTVYLGADFYSECARSFVFSDANIDSLAVDISLDLPQILGRQRNDKNPWRNKAEFYFKSFSDKSKAEALKDFANRIADKEKETNNLLNVYRNASEDDRHSLAKTYETAAKVSYYKDNYVSVNKHMGATPIPEFNKLVMLGELRAYELQQLDYRDWSSVFSQLKRKATVSTPEITAALEEFNRFTQFPDKIKVICEHPVIIDRVPDDYSKYYVLLGGEVIRANGYRKSSLERLIYDKTHHDPLTDKVMSTFTIGEKYTRVQAKNMLQTIFNELGISRTATATALHSWFLCRDCTMTVDGNRINGIEISGLI